MSTREKLIRSAAILGLAILIAGCAAGQAYRRAEKEMSRESYDEAVLHYSKAVATDPGNDRYSLALERAKLRAAGAHFDLGKRYSSSNQWELAIAELQQTILLYPGHQFAQNELQKAARELRRTQTTPSEMEQLKERAKERDLGPPKLDPRANIPILLNFKDVEVGKIYEAISKVSGINFIFDDKTDLDKPMTIDIGSVSLQKALDILMLQTKNFYKVIDEYTLLIAPDSRQKRQEYEDQVIRTFFLSNADTKQVVTLLRSLLQSRQIAENEDLNSVTIKDTPDKVAISERILNANDKAKGEVLIEVELLEIDRTLTRTLGIDLSSKSLAMTFKDGAASVPLNSLDALKQSANWAIGVIPSVTLNFLRSDSNTKVIAKPQLRVTEGEQAEILIGDRVPIPTTSFNTSQTVGGNIVPITSFTYQNVGITVQMEPRVHHNREVTLKLQVEMSQVTGSVETSGGPAQPIIGTRQIQSVIRLRDGETNMLAGLIQQTKTRGQGGVAGLSDIPGLGKLFGTTTTSNTESDIVMTITPRIIRIPDISDDDLATLWVGTEDNMRLRGAAQNALGQSPFEVSSLFADRGGSAQPPAENGTGRTRGSLARISPSTEVQQDRATPAPPPQAFEEPPQAPPPGQGGEAGETPGGVSAGEIGGQPPPQDEAEPPEEDRGADDSFTPETEQEQDEADNDQDRADADRDEPSGPAVVRLVPTKLVYAVGEPITVQVMAENVRNAASIPFHLRFNKQVLEFVSPAQEGSFMKSDGVNTVFLANDSGGGGEIIVGLSRMGGGEGMSGAGIVATFVFQSIAAGDCGFAFTGASIKNSQAGNLPASFSTVAVRVQQ